MKKSWKQQADELEQRLLEEVGEPKIGVEAKLGFVNQVILLAGLRWMEEHSESEAER